MRSGEHAVWNAHMAEVEREAEPGMVAHLLAEFTAAVVEVAAAFEFSVRQVRSL